MRINKYQRKMTEHGATEFFELAVLPMWQRFRADISATDLCCAVTVLMDQMPEWMAVEAGTSSSETRDRLKEIEPHFLQLNLAARAIKHRLLDRGPYKGLRDIIHPGKPASQGYSARPPMFCLPESPLQNSEALLEACVVVLRKELHVGWNDG